VSAPHGGDQRPRPDWRERLLGGRDRLGWWLLPLFVMVGLGGAVLAGSLAVVYYAQQVSQLESETREAREELVGAAEEVREAADEALAAIDEEVESVREELARGLPLENALDVGVVRLEVDARLEGEAEQPEPESRVEPATFRPHAARAAPEDAEEPEEPDDADQPDDDEEPEAESEDESAPPADPAPRREIPLRRSGTGFVVVVDGDTAFLVTSLGLLDDPRTDERVPADVEVTARLSAGSTTATVHSWDESNDLLLLRANIGNVEPLPWREQNDALEPGDRLIAVGATPDLEPVRVGSEIAAISGRAMVTSLPALQLLNGGPVVDGDGHVAGIAVASHHALEGDPVVVPIHRLCDQLLSACPD
jgi:S1-C subfamily serine protease